MFERRLKILLAILLLVSAALAIRAGQIQILQHNSWREQATEIMKRGQFIETTRGSIYDRKGQLMADDAPCIDACVDYPAIPEDADDAYVRSRALQLLKQRLGDQFKAASRRSDWPQTVDAECDTVRADIGAMWNELAAAGGKTPDQIDEIRRDIVQRVEMRKRYKWWHNYETAEQKEQNSSKWYREFLADSAADSDFDKYDPPIGDETHPHVILHNIPTEIQARLAREEDRFWCLSLQPSKYREYRFGRVACNVLGYLDTATPDEISGDLPELRKYWLGDMAGRAGVEALCENTLRGTRGKIETVAGTENVVDRIDAVPGKNISLTIDESLQNDIENEFLKPRVHREKGVITETRWNQHGAAVVIKVDTGEVLALVSNPGYDPKDLESDFAKLASDELNRPLMDRATELAVVPGSTAKPIVGSGSITDHIMKATDRIQCHGELMIDGKPQSYGHCWTYALLKNSGAPISHAAAGDKELAPYNDMLCISDGIKDSCNVVFETVALRMGIADLCKWFRNFGLGRRTGIGIEENPGLLFGQNQQFSVEAQTQTWSLGIGEGHIQATPIQMANVAATIARNGIWMRPRLVADADVGRFGPHSSDDSIPDRVDLHLSPEALGAVQLGMREVCTSDGSGFWILPDSIERGPDDPPADQDPLRNIPIAGKTGSAQTGGFMSIMKRDAAGKFIGFQQIHFGDPETQGWYIKPASPDGTPPEKHLAHAWFMGYAPADHPQIAFCVLVEYGASGGRVAGPIAHDLLVDCFKHGYLSASK